MAEVRLITKLFGAKLNKLIDKVCLVLIAGIILFWNTPWYQSGKLWTHAYGAYSGDFITTSESSTYNLQIIFCYHTYLFIFLKSNDKPFLERFGVYQIKGE